MDGLFSFFLNLQKLYASTLAQAHRDIFASTTFEYLRDSQFNTFKPEFVAFELLERDVFSCLATMLLQMAFGDRYTRLDPREKTRVITTMDLSPFFKDRPCIFKANSFQYALFNHRLQAPLNC
jgi:hypothetical protein